MSKFDFSEIIKKTYKKESTDIKEVEYYESLEVSKILDQKESVEEAKDDNKVSDDRNNLKDVLSNLTSLITGVTALFAGISMFTNALFAFKAEKYYKVPVYLFNGSRNFEFIIRLAIYILTIHVLISPFILRDKWRNNKIDRFESFLLSLTISLYIVLITFVILINFLIAFNINININYIYIISLILWIFLSRLFHYIITDAPKFLIKSRDDFKLRLNITKEVGDTNLPKSKLRLYMFYILLILFVVICTAGWAFSSINLDPKYKMSYEILKDEKDFNVIIGYKDGMAISLTGEELISGGETNLNFISNEYVLQDVKDKVIIYKTFDKVEPFEEVEEKKEESKN